jgi:beta-glucosidase
MNQTITIQHEGGELEIDLLLGTDAVHGNQHVIGEVLFPHNIGLAATHNIWHFAKAGYWTGKSVMDAGFNYLFAPTVAVSHNPQWGRYYETLGTDPEIIAKYAYEYVTKAQAVKDGVMTGALTSTKHFLGDGATFNGNDEGNTHVNNFTAFYRHNVQGYLGGLAADTGTIMCSYSAINGIPMSMNAHPLTGILKDKMKFDGFVISDYTQIQKSAEQGLPTSYLKMTVA